MFIAKKAQGGSENELVCKGYSRVILRNLSDNPVALSDNQKSFSRGDYYVVNSHDEPLELDIRGMEKLYFKSQVPDVDVCAILIKD